MMDELACLMDWDLKAIVRGPTSETPATIIDNPHPNFSHFCSQQDDLLCSFPEFSETTTVLDELEEFYEPFYPVLHPLSTQTIITTSVPMPKQVKAPEEVQDYSQDLAVSKCKRSKKNQNKKVVKQVTADGLCDTWAWRKYGQKPIKGSPYPRSYYRCSTSKGCSARKQVERSHLDPGVFIVTYTAEHSHHHPTRRNSLAGRIKSSIAPKLSTQYQFRSLNAAAVRSSRTPSVESIEDELVPRVQSEGLKKEEDLLELSEDVEGSETVTANILVGDDWFPSIEELNGLSQELALDCCFMDTFAETLLVNKSNVLSGGS